MTLADQMFANQLSSAPSAEALVPLIRGRLTGACGPTPVWAQDEDYQEILYAEFQRSLTKERRTWFLDALRDSLADFAAADDLEALGRTVALCLRLPQPADAQRWDHLPEFDWENQAAARRNGLFLALLAAWGLRTDDFWRDTHERIVASFPTAPTDLRGPLATALQVRWQRRLLLTTEDWFRLFSAVGECRPVPVDLLLELAIDAWQHCQNMDSPARQNCEEGFTEAFASGVQRYLPDLSLLRPPNEMLRELTEATNFLLDHPWESGDAKRALRECGASLRRGAEKRRPSLWRQPTPLDAAA